MCARYGPEALLAATSLVIGGVRSLHELLDVVDTTWSPEPSGDRRPADTFLDVDTPDDAERLGIEPPGVSVTV